MIEKPWRPADWTNLIPVERPRSLEPGVYPVLPEPEPDVVIDTEELIPATLPKWAEYAARIAIAVIAVAVLSGLLLLQQAPA